MLTDTTQEDAEVAKLEAELTALAEQIEQMIKTNASKEQDQGEYTKRFDEISNWYEQVKSTYDKAVEERQVKISKGLKLDAFLSLVKKANR